jgi:RHS repeat-associated protein
MTTGAGDTSQFAVQYPAAGGRLRLFTGPDGSTVRSANAPNGQQTETWPDGSVMTTTLSPDSRFGLQSPIVTSEQRQLPSGLSLTTSSSRSVVLSVPGDPLSLSSQTDTWTVNGQTSTRLFDRLQMRWTFQTPTGRQATAAVNSTGRPTLLQVGTFAPLQLSYDTAGRLISATRGSGTGQRTVAFNYGADGRLQTLIDPLQRTFSFVWDAAGRLRSRTLPDGRIVGFSYDADGNLTSVTPPGRPFHAFAFTPVNLEQSYTAPDLGSGPSATTYGYDLDRRLTKITRPDGSTIVLAYRQGRLASLNYPEGTISLTYDPGTSLLQTVSGPGAEVLAYTSDGPLPIKTSWSGPVSGSIERSFNQDLRLSSQTVNGQLGVAFQYDNDGLLTQAGSFSVSRDPSSGLVTGTSLGAVTTSETQDDLGELSSSSAAYAGSEILRADFTRDAAGRIARDVETILGSANIYDYTYDTVGRLTDVALNGAPLSHYAYDTNSNRVAAVEGSVTTTAAYDSQDRLLQWGDVTYAYSTSGDLASKTQNGSTIAYTYDALGNLLTVIDASGIKTEYIVDGQNRRVGKKVNGALVQGFLWQDRLKIAAELDGAGNIVSRFIFATHVNVPDYMINNGIVYRILTDHLGSPRLVVNVSSGEIAQRMDYDAWGAVLQDTNPGFQPFGFRGGLYDTRTGLIRFGARDYEPGTGRWTAKDPILFAGGSTDLYGYAADDPVNLTDPEGLIPPPPSNWPLPPGWNSSWGWQYPEGNSPASPRWFDPEGGEWRWHAPDKWHQDGHWDHNPWDRWNSPWQNVPHKPCPLPEPSPEPVPWWQSLPDLVPDPLPIILNPCFFIPSLCLGTGTGAVEA